MNNRVNTIRIGPPESLGEPVAVRIGQAAAFLQREDETTELYIVSNGHPAIFYAVELPSGRVVHEYAIPESHAVWGMTLLGNDVYFCATDDGILYRYAIEERKVEQVGSFPSGAFVWDMGVSSDRKVYGATYPQAQLFEYDPESSQFLDLGRMHEEQHYARGMLALGDYLFAGIGSELHLIQYDRRTKQKKELHVEGYTGSKGFISRIFPSPLQHTIYLFAGGYNCLVYDYKKEAIVDSFAAGSYISEPSPEDGEQYYVHDAQLYSYHVPSRRSAKRADLPLSTGGMLVKDMAWIKNGDGQHALAIATTNMDVIIYNPASGIGEALEVDVPARPVSIQSLEWDREERLYIGGYHRGLAVYNIATREVDMNLTTFPQIEGIGFSKGTVYLGTYTKANIYAYRPRMDTRPSFLFQVGHHQDRPFAIAEAGNKVFFGTIADYGLLTGAMSMYDTTTGAHETYPDLVPNQSIIGLAYRDGLIYGGTTNWGGLGIEAVETEAKLFVWDVEQRKLLYSFTPDIPGIDMPPRMIGELRFGPDGLLWGAVDGTLFAMCPDTLTVTKSKLIVPSEYKYSHLRPYFLRWSSDGLLFAGLAKKIMVIDPETLAHSILVDDAIPLMTLGPDDHIYYNIGSELFMRKRLP
ncbi:hypothetical protein M6D81_30870 [Paenibacillus sp. J5C_2022]|uniref:hypothetical protein n=1 Tax=Paenibacillus sp. J5C2022 TaxID=2977129 RepID=UPI0021CF3C8C|nr:hypothetical protein [Paenibacillus sp. J5C2022]MCU6713111.1 hypothetical protein [Paenibacillus sp. J5C2022]